MLLVMNATGVVLVRHCIIQPVVLSRPTDLPLKMFNKRAYVWKCFTSTLIFGDG